ncbi:MAG: hypothetical protein ACJAYU_001050 [Bradymonadia bacterium]|jgi:hypothetical protein
MTLALTACTAAGPAGTDAIELLPITDQTVLVDETLVVTLAVNNPDGTSLSYSYDAPTVAGIERVATIGGSPAGGEFRWTPLASQVGRHELTFRLSFSGGEVTQAVVVDVSTVGDAAPVFVMAAGGAYDLERDPCVVFPVEVRDDDTEVVRMNLEGAAPDGANVDVLGPKSAQFTWCPTPDQTDASLRWTLTLSADDSDHPPVLQDYLVVLQTPAKEGCAGDSPTISIRQPDAGVRVASAGGYPIVVDVTDDGQLRESPLLYWTTDPVEFPDNPNLTAFQQLEFAESDAQWRARVPSFGLADGEERIVRYVVLAYDNDDSEGTACDHRAQTITREFVAVAGDDSGALGPCEPCTSNEECGSGLCANSGGGLSCSVPCSNCPGECTPATTGSGGSVEVCGGCGGASTPSSCVDDAAEDNDDLPSASTLTSAAGATICPNDDDFWRITADGDQQLTVSVLFSNTEGDLDLRVRNAQGAILGSSASVEDVEAVTTCVAGGGFVIAQVLGFSGSQADYDIEVARVDTFCECTPDEFEPNDSVDDSRIAPFGVFDGSICPGDEDVFVISGPGQAFIEVSFDGAALDLDVELVGPDGAVIDSSRTTDDVEVINAAIGPGTHSVRIFPFDDGAIDYIAEIDVGDPSGCEDSQECPVGTICDDGDCDEVSCNFEGDCPEAHTCPLVGPGDPLRSCAESCFDSFDCRDGEACKLFPSGGACAATGRGAVGDACDDFSDCGGTRVCLDREDGYCATASCDLDSDCDPGSFCVDEGGDRYCAKDCGLGAFLCRIDQECEILDSVSDALVFVCLP